MRCNGGNSVGGGSKDERDGRDERDAALGHAANNRKDGRYGRDVRVGPVGLVGQVRRLDSGDGFGAGFWLSGVDESAGHFIEGVEPKGMLVEARDEGEFFSACIDKGFVGANADFFEGLQAISNKGGADDEEFFDAFGGELGQFEVGIGLQPWVAS